MNSRGAAFPRWWKCFKTRKRSGRQMFAVVSVLASFRLASNPHPSPLCLIRSVCILFPSILFSPFSNVRKMVPDAWTRWELLWWIWKEMWLQPCPAVAWPWNIRAGWARYMEGGVHPHSATSCTHICSSILEFGPVTLNGITPNSISTL